MYSSGDEKVCFFALRYFFIQLFPIDLFPIDFFDESFDEDFSEAFSGTFSPFFRDGITGSSLMTLDFLLAAYSMYSSGDEKVNFLRCFRDFVRFISSDLVPFDFFGFSLNSVLPFFFLLLPKLTLALRFEPRVSVLTSSALLLSIGTELSWSTIFIKAQNTPKYWY